MKSKWSVKQLKKQLEADLLCCNNNFERSMVQAIGGIEIRERAIQLFKEGRLTPVESAIAQEFGFRA